MAEAEQRDGLGRLVAGCPGELQCLLVMVGGLLVPALQPMDVAEAGQRGQLGGLVAGGAC
jgi:hypothetical protein